MLIIVKYFYILLGLIMFIISLSNIIDNKNKNIKLKYDSEFLIMDFYFFMILCMLLSMI